MKKQSLKKVLSIFLTVLMILSCCIFVVPSDVKAEEFEDYFSNSTDENGSSIVEHEHDYATRVIVPTCHSMGYKLSVCRTCNHTIREDEKPATEKHDWNWKENPAGSCLEARTRTGICRNDGCTATKTEVMKNDEDEVLVGNHVYVIVKGKDAKCTEVGYTDYTRCTVCGEVTESTEIAAIGHKDEDNNGNCDACNALTNLEIGTCGCLCHNDSGFGRFIYKIAIFLWKLLKIQQTCDCKIQHW